jgi:hypothetical protein
LGARAAARLSHALHPRRLHCVVRAVMLKGANLNEVGFELTMQALFVAAYASLHSPVSAARSTSADAAGGLARRFPDVGRATAVRLVGRAGGDLRQIERMISDT